MQTVIGIVLGIISVLVFITISLDEITKGGKMDRKTFPRLRCQHVKGEKVRKSQQRKLKTGQKGRRRVGKAKPNVSRRVIISIEYYWWGK